MQSDRSGQLVGTSLARDDVSHHYSFLNAIKQKGIKSNQRKEQQKWVGVRKDSGLIMQTVDKHAYVNNGAYTQWNYTHTHKFLKHTLYLIPTYIFKSKCLQRYSTHQKKMQTLGITHPPIPSLYNLMLTDTCRMFQHMHGLISNGPQQHVFPH